VLIMKKIAIFASGSGTNAQAIAEYFAKNDGAKVDCILTNNSQAFVLERAKLFSVPSIIFSKDDFYHTPKIINLLKEREIDLIVLAGFLWLLPPELVHAFPERIINIHPALLPKYGGKGMYGMKVHQAVIENKEKESGITIHYVNEKYDEGNIIFQAKCKIDPSDTPEMLAEKIHELEHIHFPRVVGEIVIRL
jgi:phosphoribosylglycinamide formyltransferase-1